MRRPVGANDGLGVRVLLYRLAHPAPRLRACQMIARPSERTKPDGRRCARSSVAGCFIVRNHLKPTLFVLAAIFLAACSSPESNVSCGPGTVLQDGSCVVADGGTDSTIAKDSTNEDADVAGDDTFVGDGAGDGTPDTSSDGDAKVDVSPDAGDAGPGGKLNWAERFGVSGHTAPNAVAIDPTTGDVVVGGRFFGTTDFGGGAVKSVGDGITTCVDAFIVKLDSNGKYKWAKRFGSGACAEAMGVAVDAAGNVTVAVNFRGSADFGGGTVTAAGTQDLFLAQYDALGAYKWGKAFGSPGPGISNYGAAVDGAGNLFIAGRSVSIDFGGGALTGFYVAKFNAKGVHSWSKAFDAKSSAGGPWLAVDSSGNSFLAGNFQGTADFGAGIWTSPKGGTRSDVFLAKFGPSGTFQWARHYGDGAASSGVASDGTGNVFITGDISFIPQTMDFGGGVVLSASDSGKGAVFLAKIGPSGDGAWARLATGSMTARNVTVAGAGGAVISVYGGNVDFGGGSLVNSGVGLGSFDAAGKYRWGYGVSAPSTATKSITGYIQGLGGSATTLVVAGEFGSCAGSCSTTSLPGSTLVLPGKTLTALSASDMFVASFTP
jgi:hypothetical protein